MRSSENSSVPAEDWQLGELSSAIAELDAGLEVSHEEVLLWLTSWGQPAESKAPKL